MKPIKIKKYTIIVGVLIGFISFSSQGQQFNTDNYLTMPHGTGTFVLTGGERDASMYATFALRPRFELNFSVNAFWEDKSTKSPQHFSTNVFGKYMFWVNEANNAGAAVFLGVGRSPGYYNANGYSSFHKNYWTAVPLTIPLLHNTISWDLMPGALVDFEYGDNKEASWGFTWSTRVAIYKIIPKTAIVGELYGTEGTVSSETEFKVGLRWEPNDYIVPAISYSAGLNGGDAAGFEIGVIIFTPTFLKKDYIKNNHITY